MIYEQISEQATKLIKQAKAMKSLCAEGKQMLTGDTDLDDCALDSLVDNIKMTSAQLSLITNSISNYARSSDE